MSHCKSGSSETRDDTDNLHVLIPVLASHTPRRVISAPSPRIQAVQYSFVIRHMTLSRHLIRQMIPDPTGVSRILWTDLFMLGSSRYCVQILHPNVVLGRLSTS